MDNMTAMWHHAQYYTVLRSEIKGLCMHILCIDRQLKIKDSTRWPGQALLLGTTLWRREDGELTLGPSRLCWMQTRGAILTDGCGLRTVRHKKHNSNSSSTYHQVPVQGTGWKTGQEPYRIMGLVLSFPYSAMYWCLLSSQHHVLASPVLKELCASISCPVYGSWELANSTYKTFL